MGDRDLPVLTSNPRGGGLSDERGYKLFTGSTESSATVPSFDDRGVEFALYGLLNGSFARGPDNPDANIEDGPNPLPDWSGPFSVSGDRITCQWVADSGSESGYNLRFTLPPNGAVGDESYVEQIVPIGGSRGRNNGARARAWHFLSSGTAGDATLQVKLQYLNVSGAAVGSAGSGSADSSLAAGLYTTAVAHSTATSPPATVRYLRIRVHVRRAVLTDVATVDISDVRLERSVTGLILGERSTPGSFASGYMIQQSGTITATPGGSGFIISLPNGNGYLALDNGHLELLGLASNPTLSGTADNGVFARDDGFLYHKVSGGSTYNITTHAGQTVSPDNIQFPAVQVASADPNNLDDYEEGTWTPRLFFATAGTSNIVTSTATGWYRKVGGLIVYGFVVVTSTFTLGTAAGTIRVDGFPFTFSASFPSVGGGAFSGYTKAGYTSISARPIGADVYFRFFCTGSGVVETELAVGDFTSGTQVTVRMTGSVGV